MVETTEGTQVALHKEAENYAEKQVALMKAQETQLDFHKDSAKEAATLCEVIARQRAIVAMSMQEFKIENKEAETEIKKKFSEVTSLYGDTEKLWLGCQKNLETIPQLISAMLDKYATFVSGKGAKLKWNTEYTRVTRETIVDQLKMQKTEEAKLTELEKQTRDALQSIEEKLGKEGGKFEGKVAQAKQQGEQLRQRLIEANESYLQLQDE